MAASRPTILQRNHAFVFALCDSLGRAMDGWRGIKNGVPRVDLSQRYPRSASYLIFNSVLRETHRGLALGPAG